MKEVCLVIQIEISENILESYLRRPRTIFSKVQIILIKARVRIVSAGEQGSKSIDNCTLSNVVRPNDDI